METLDIPKTSSTPMISFDSAASTLKIVGESYPENSFEFYAPVIAWVKEGLQQLSQMRLDIDVSYMNSSSTKCVLDLFDIMEEAYGRGVDVSVCWRYDRENPRSLDLAEEFQEEVTFPFDVTAPDE